MQTLKQAQAPALPTLLVWIAYYVSRVRASMSARHRAVAVAAIVAGGGNPSGF